ncbi:MAG: cupredoxin domain-containing protein [Patescibacteria group bacterium]|nr:cupredoxin domain-containing protein [Patescibacteria group bacterium]
MDKLLVVIAGILSITAIAWWFFGNKQQIAIASEQTASEQTATITVDGGYSPAVLSLKAGIPAKITFLRKDPSGCLEEVIMPDFGVAEKLPVNEPLVVTILPKAAGEFTYTCGMRMFSGKIQVV